MNRIFFTSDLHLNHNKPFIYENRGFSDIRSHDRTVIQSINDYVEPDDSLYILGDLCMGNTQDPGEYKYIWDLLKQIKCQHVFIILGNHENSYKADLYKTLNFVVYGDSKMIPYFDKKQKYFLSHYPTLTQNGSLKGQLHREVINLFGHTHQTNPFLEINGLTIPLSYHVGLDSNNMHPIELGEIRDLVYQKYHECIDSGLYTTYPPRTDEQLQEDFTL